MTADIFRILVFATIPMLFVEVFLVLNCTGVNQKFEVYMITILILVLPLALFLEIWAMVSDNAVSQKFDSVIMPAFIITMSLIVYCSFIVAYRA